MTHVPELTDWQRGVIYGFHFYAIMRDGTYYVGIGTHTLKQAVEALLGQGPLTRDQYESILAECRYQAEATEIARLRGWLTRIASRTVSPASAQDATWALEGLPAP